jgi:hypothetical protein
MRRTAKRPKSLAFVWWPKTCEAADASLVKEDRDEYHTKTSSRFIIVGVDRRLYGGSRHRLRSGMRKR